MLKTDDATNFMTTIHLIKFDIWVNMDTSFVKP